MEKILGHSDYYITNDGRVWSEKNKKFLKPGLNTPGYLFVVLSEKGKTKITSIHREVAKCYVQNPENKKWVNHKNGIKTDNRAENLEWCTRTENISHAYSTGLIQIGKFHPAAKKVINTSTGDIYDTLKDAAEKIGMKRACLGKMLNGINRNKTTLKYF